MFLGGRLAAEKDEEERIDGRWIPMERREERREKER